jgi:hypothetical protein
VITEGRATSGAILHGEILKPFMTTAQHNVFVDIDASYDTHSAFSIEPWIGGRD